MNIAVHENCLVIQGAVTVQSVTLSDYKHFQKIIKQPEINTLDLNGVVRADSACISLILTALRNNKNLKIKGISQAIQDLADLYELKNEIQDYI